MKNDFDKKIKDIEQELIDLKTANKYTSVRSASYTADALVYTGVYRISYENTDNPIFSIVYCSFMDSHWGIAYPRTPNGNEQIVEIDTTFFDSDLSTYVTKQVPLSIASNILVTGIERIS